mmetsp:Transcript_1445/g.4361  ORF Transcript_1445/g.4361 Transcript_1445/m.4361 type:complete len:88 (+) Transcript_1445:179-442(+)
MMRPCSSTRISWASTTVDSRCAMTSTVLFWPTDSSSAWMARSLVESSAEVASSKISSGGFFSSVRAIATRCFSPPDSFRPRSPTMVS